MVALVLKVIFTCFKMPLYFIVCYVNVVFYPKMAVLKHFRIIHRNDEIDPIVFFTLKVACLSPALWTVFCCLLSANF